MATSALNQLTGMPNLPVTRGVLSGMPAAPKGYIGPKEIAPAQEELAGAIGAAEQKVGQADIGIETAKREEKARELEVKGESLAKFAKDIEAMPEKAALKEDRETLKGMEFVPTRDTVQDIAALFSLIGVIGMVAGKGNAMQAMNAMNGMLEGHQKGRKDLFRQEQITFDKNFKAMQTKIQQSLADYQEALELKKIDKEAGELKKQVALARAESPLLKAMDQKLGEVRTLNTLKETKQSVDKAVTLQNDLQAKADQRAREERQRQESLASRGQLFQGSDGKMYSFNPVTQKVAEVSTPEGVTLARPTGAGAKDAKPPPKEIVAQNQLRNSLIPKIEEALPVLDRLQREGKWNTMTTLLAVDPRAAEMQFRDDKEALNLVLTLAYFRSKEFETAGKALTRKEDQILAPIVRGDLRAYEGIKNAMEQGVKSLKQEQKGLEATYPFIREYNKALRGETEDSAPPAPGGKPMPTGDKLKAYADQHFGGDEDAARTYLQSQGYQ